MIRKNTYDLSYDKVLRFAKKKHKGQVRKDGKTPYIQHPIAVAEFVRKYKNYSKNLDVLVAGALLHDTLEDTFTSYKELEKKFGIVVASLVMELTSASYVGILEGKPNYLKHKMQWMTKYALVIKLADRLSNLKDMKYLAQETQERLCADTIEIVEHLEEHVKLTGAQQELINEIKKEINTIKENEERK